MKLIRPFSGLRPVANHLDQIIAPPYDVVNTEEAKAFAENKPWNFLHISKPQIDLAEDESHTADEVYAQGAENIKKFFNEHILEQDSHENFYLYRIEQGEHSQTGLVAAASALAYQENKILKHELTRPDKEDDRVRILEALQAQVSPVLLTYRYDKNVDELFKSITGNPAEYTAMLGDTKHSLWLVKDKAVIQQLNNIFNNIDALYIADGHHRSAAAARYAQSQKKPEADLVNYFLAVLFPDTEMKILGYHRVVKDLSGLDPAKFLQQIDENFTREVSDTPVEPVQARQMGMYLDNTWYRLTYKDDVDSTDPIAELDVTILHKNIIEPILNITDPRTDKRIDFVGGSRGVKELERRVNSGEMQVAFALYPTSIDQLLKVADSNNVMPPKSTWFDPKLADGLIAFKY